MIAGRDLRVGARRDREAVEFSLRDHDLLVGGVLAAEVGVQLYEVSVYPSGENELHDVWAGHPLPVVLDDGVVESEGDGSDGELVHQTMRAGARSRVDDGDDRDPCGMCPQARDQSRPRVHGRGARCRQRGCPRRWRLGGPHTQPRSRDMPARAGGKSEPRLSCLRLSRRGRSRARWRWGNAAQTCPCQEGHTRRREPRDPPHHFDTSKRAHSVHPPAITPLSYRGGQIPSGALADTPSATPDKR